jgi:hypothetical protein
VEFLTGRNQSYKNPPLSSAITPTAAAKLVSAITSHSNRWDDGLSYPWRILRGSRIQCCVR